MRCPGSFSRQGITKNGIGTIGYAPNRVASLWIWSSSVEKIPDVTQNALIYLSQEHQRANPSRAEAGIFEVNLDNNMVIDALTPCVAKYRQSWYWLNMVDGSLSYTRKDLKYVWYLNVEKSLRWRHYDHDGVSNQQPRGCLLNRLFRRSSKKTSKLRVTGLCEGNSPGPVNSPHKGPVTRKTFPFDDVIMWWKMHTNMMMLYLDLSV